MKPMLMSDANEIPVGKEWIYETKYDGFRTILHWNKEGIQLFSRNEKLLNEMFPEIIEACRRMEHLIKPFLPIVFDGELVYLQNDFRSEFSIVQTRGRMRKKEVIAEHSIAFPCQYIVFDLITFKGKDMANSALEKRKMELEKCFEKLGLPCHVKYRHESLLQMIETFTDGKELWNHIRISNGEGIIAKQKRSIWSNEKRTNQWLKVKNWRQVTIIITKYEQVNGFFTGSVYHEREIIEVVTFKHGMTDEEMKTLSELFLANGKSIGNSIYEIAPSICANINCISFDGKHLREPRFHSFAFEMNPEECEWRQMLRQLNPIPENVQVTHPDKPVWPKSGIEKEDYLLYLQMAAPFMLPFLKERHLTLIRFPHGVPGEKFYQKSVPDYAPDFVKTSRDDDIDYIVCNDIMTLLWLGNQLALEFHIPFQTIDTKMPTEIVFDLDPPSVDEFSLSIEAAVRLKAIFDQFQLESFIKTSGGKGLQLYIPLPYNTFTYDETRIFTKFVSDFLCDQEPQWFTTERLKKNRGNKLYLDYVQHHEGKTIVAPYSPRGTEIGTIATPLKWEEVGDSLRPEQFTIHTVMERMKTIGDPFREFRKVGEAQPFSVVLEQLKELL
ncbi:DNA ligase D [Sporosarcina highlanderae]|uniref:DNA ligase (ATP) n=1 Tax=Sporosarcina highlanderae TaxID=3035916 RepID=A0ABT8JRJ7_9BACL|nr:DNA ligase D [Sporosarcina highlanderae]MDN4607007.1 DNA ligase D [Sporosarcina highlanderae]